MEINWYFNENGEDIIIPLEKWAWHVIYKDGSELHQFEPDRGADGKLRFHQFQEIDLDNVMVFEMINTENPALRYSIDCSEGIGQIFHFYRRTRLHMGTDDEQHVTFYCFGYKVNDVSLYHFILPDNRIVITSNRDLNLL